jgi:hypothetical protein
LEGTITVTATASDGGGVERVELWYSRDGGEWMKHPVDATGIPRWTLDLGAIGGDGNYSFYTRAWDVTGKHEDAPEVEDAWVVLDTMSPTSKVDDLPEWTSNETLEITAGAEDSGGIAGVELWYRHDGGPWTLYDTAGVEPFQWEFNTSEADGDGSYQFFSRARDLAGWYEDAPIDNDTGTVVDTIRPSSKVEALVNHQTTFIFEVQAVSTDEVGVSHVELWYRRDDGRWHLYGRTIDLPATWAFDTGGLGGDGWYQFYSRAWDLAGNYEEVPLGNDTWTLVDTRGPTITVLSPKDGSTIGSTNLKVSCTATDASGVGRLEARIDDGDHIVFNEDGMLTFDDVSDGEHTITIRAIDIWGNTEETTLEVTVEGEGPLGGSSLYLMVAVIVVLLVFIVVLVYLRKGRK